MPTITISMDILTKIITICVCLLIIAAAFFNIITLGGFSISSIILSIYYMYKPKDLECLQLLSLSHSAKSDFSLNTLDCSPGKLERHYIAFCNR